MRWGGDTEGGAPFQYFDPKTEKLVGFEVDLGVRRRGQCGEDLPHGRDRGLVADDEVEAGVAMLAGEPRQGRIGVGWRTLGDLAVADHPEDQRKHRSLVPTNQLPVGGLAPLLGLRDEVRVGIVGLGICDPPALWHLEPDGIELRRQHPRNARLVVLDIKRLAQALHRGCRQRFCIVSGSMQ